jgi:hypothetical protein
MYFSCNLEGIRLREDNNKYLFKVMLDLELTSKDRLAVGN